MIRIRQAVRRYAGVFAVLGMLLLLLPLGLVQGAAPGPAAVPVYLDNVDVVAGGAFTTNLHVDNIPVPGVAGYTIGVVYPAAKLVFLGSPTCGVTMLAAGFDILSGCGTAGAISSTGTNAAGPWPTGNLSLLKYSGTAAAVAATTAATMALTVDLIDPLNADPLPGQVVTNGTITIWVAPVASFSTTCTDANASTTCDSGETFQFTSTSTNMVPMGEIRSLANTYVWTFGNGNVSALQNPTQVYGTFPQTAPYDPVTGKQTYSVCLTVTNFAGANGPVCNNVIVAPGAVASATLTPSNPTTQPAGVINFDAVAKDANNNPIPEAQLATEIFSATGTLGTIVAGTGVLTVTGVAGVYVNGVCVSVTYKTGAVSPCTNVTVVSMQALIGLDKTAPYPPVADNFPLLIVKILDTIDPITLGHLNATNGIAAYTAKLTYDPGQFNVMGVIGGDATWGTPDASLINNVGGITTFTDTQTDTANQAPDIVVNLYPRLMGCVDTVATVTLTFTLIADGNGSPIPPVGTFSKSFRRGDAKADGTVNISDALFIAQYLVGLRGIGQTPLLVHPINAASAKQDTTAPNIDKISSADKLTIAQYVVGLRNNCFVLLADPTPPER